MTDWDRVERLRAKGLDWDSIASDPRVEFSAPEGSGRPGRVLKTLYFQRRSTDASRRPDSKPQGAKGRFKPGESPSPPTRLFRYGAFMLPTGALWSVLAILVPSPIGVAVPFVPYLLGLTLVGAGLAAYGWLRRANIKTTTWVKPVAAGVVVGLVFAGMAGLVALSVGAPVLSTNTIAEPGGWARAPNHLWTSSSEPIFFFWGSVACPFCSASSWSMRGALEAFGNLSGWTYWTSSPTDPAGPNTPEVDLASASLASSYISMDIKEGDDNQQITEPPTSFTENAYITTYDSPTLSIPFVVVGGIFIHAQASLVSPQVLRDPSTGQALTTSQVETDLASGSGTVYTAIHSAQIYLEAVMVVAIERAGLTPPSQVANNAEVAAAVGAIQ